MVLILSTTTDYNTNYVIEWLRFYKIAFVRLSFENILEFENLYVINKKNIEITFTVDNKKYKLSDFKAFWYRRSQFDFSFKKTVGKNKILKQINNHLFYESTQIFKLFIKQLEKLAINKFKDVSLNKIEVLNNAVEIGLIAPFSLITQNKSDVLNDEFNELFRESKLARLYYKAHLELPEICQSCTIQNICGGGYLGHRYSPDNDFDNPTIYCKEIIHLVAYMQNKILDNLPITLVDKLELTYLNAEEILESLYE